MVRIDGSRVRQLREQQGLTQLYVATAVGVTTDTISRWENKKYPSVKKENALKLAETLEVELNHILEMDGNKPPDETTHHDDEENATSPDGHETEKDKQQMNTADAEPPPHFSAKPRRFSLIAALIMIIAAGIAGSAWYFHQGRPDIRVTATRYLPDHAPPGSPFPVIISISCTASEKISLILTEHIPAQAEILKAAPPWSASSPDRKKIKWITATSGPEVTICYMAATRKDTEPGTKIFFHGDVTSGIKGRETCPVKGSDSMTPAPFHWADTNRDGQIDDEEILRVFDKLGSIKGLASGLDDIKRIWSSGGYGWDTEQNRYLTDNIQKHKKTE